MELVGTTSNPERKYGVFLGRVDNKNVLLIFEGSQNKYQFELTNEQVQMLNYHSAKILWEFMQVVPR